MNLSELKALCEAATPGPWKLTEHVAEQYGPDYTLDAADGECLIENLQYYPTAPSRREDARFIAAARTYLPKLIAIAEAVGSLRKEALSYENWYTFVTCEFGERVDAAFDALESRERKEAEDDMCG